MAKRITYTGEKRTVTLEGVQEAPDGHEPGMLQVPESKMKEAYLGFAPTLEQVKFAQYMFTHISTSGKTPYSAAAKSIGVKESLIREWYTDSAFMLWMHEIRKQNFEAWKPLFDIGLIKAMKKGQRWAFELFYKLVGDLDTTVETKTLMQKKNIPENESEQWEMFQQKLVSIKGNLSPTLTSGVDNKNKVEQAVETESETLESHAV